MGLAAGSAAGVARVQVGLVDHLDALGRECRGQRIDDALARVHTEQIGSDDLDIQPA